MPKKAEGTKKAVPASSRTTRSKGAPHVAKSGDKDLTASEAEKFLNRKTTTTKSKAKSPSPSPKKRKAPTKAKESPKKKMKRANTMAVTAAEGDKILERDEKRSESPKSPRKSKSPPKKAAAAKKGKKATSPTKMKRANTMAVTAAEGEKILEEEGGIDEKRGRKGDDKSDEEAEPKMKRANTMAVTAAEGEKILAKEDKKKGSPRKSPRGGKTAKKK